MRVLKIGINFWYLSFFNVKAGIPVTPLSDSCELISEKGEAVDKQTDKRMDFHFNAILDIIAEWRKGRELAQDTSLLGKEKLKE